MSSKRHVVECGAKGFVVKASPEYQAKQAREQRMRERKEKPPANPTVKDLFALLMDIADRQAELYDMVKELKKNAR